MSNLDQSQHIVLWQKIMSRIHENLEIKDFEMPDTVVEATVCKISGKLARSSCPSVTDYFDKESLGDTYCTSHRGYSGTVFSSGNYYSGGSSGGSSSYSGSSSGGSSDTSSESETTAESNTSSGSTDNSADTSSGESSGGTQEGAAGETPPAEETPQTPAESAPEEMPQAPAEGTE